MCGCVSDRGDRMKIYIYIYTYNMSGGINGVMLKNTYQTPCMGRDKDFESA